MGFIFNTDTGGVVAPGSITDVELATNAVIGTKIAANSVNDSHIVNGAVRASHIGIDEVNSSHLADDSVTSIQIAASAITATELATDAVTTDKIRDDNVTTEKLSSSFLELLAVSTYTGIDFTGVADSATALQTLINSYTGKKLYLPAGTIKTTTVINIPANTVVEGSSGFRTTIHYQPVGANQNGITMQSGSSLVNMVVKQTGYQTQNNQTSFLVSMVSQTDVSLQSVRIIGPAMISYEVVGTLQVTDADSNLRRPTCCLYTSDCSLLHFDNVYVGGANLTYGWECANVTDSHFEEITCNYNGFDGLKLFYDSEYNTFTNFTGNANGQSALQLGASYGETGNGEGIDMTGNYNTFHGVICNDNQGSGIQLKTTPSNTYCHHNTFSNTSTIGNGSNGIGLVNASTPLIDTTTGLFSNNQFTNVNSHSNVHGGITISPSTGSDYAEIIGSQFSDIICRNNGGAGLSCSTGDVTGLQISNAKMLGNGTSGGIQWGMVLRGKDHQLNNVYISGIDPESQGCPTDALINAATPRTYGGLYLQTNVPGDGDLDMTNVKITNCVVEHNTDVDVAYYDNTTGVSYNDFIAAGADVTFINCTPNPVVQYSEQIPLNEGWIWNAATHLPTSVTGDDLWLSSGSSVFFSGPILSGGPSNGSNTAYARYFFILPHNYVDGTALYLDITGYVDAAVASESCVVDIQAYYSLAGDTKHTYSSDICTTVAQSINSATASTKTFNLTGTNLKKGMMITFRVAVTWVNATSGIYPTISKIVRRY